MPWYQDGQVERQAVSDSVHAWTLIVQFFASYDRVGNGKSPSALQSFFRHHSEGAWSALMSPGIKMGKWG
jgi:hypothetical protein